MNDGKERATNGSVIAGYARRAVNWIGYPISAVFLYFTFRNTDFKVILNNLQHVDAVLLLGALGAYAGFFLIRAQYQIVNLRFVKARIGFLNSLEATSAALVYNAILPARMGEVVRAYNLSASEGISKATLLSYIFVEKLLDFLVIICLLVVLVGTYGGGDAQIDRLVAGSVLVIIAMAAGLFVYVRWNPLLVKFAIRFVPAGLEHFFLETNASVKNGLGFYKSVAQIAAGLVLLLASWSLVILTFWFVSLPYVKLLGLPGHAAAFLMVFSAISLSVPSAPSGVGVVHYGLLAAIHFLTRGALDAARLDVAVACVLVVHFFTLVLDLVVGGGYILLCRAIRWHGLSGEQRFAGKAERPVGGTAGE